VTYHPTTLIARPEAGDLIPGSGGLRKLRWRLPGVLSDLSPAELRTLRKLVSDD
jgi:hypothetical protein